MLNETKILNGLALVGLFYQTYGFAPPLRGKTVKEGFPLRVSKEAIKPEESSQDEWYLEANVAKAVRSSANLEHDSTPDWIAEAFMNVRDTGLHVHSVISSAQPQEPKTECSAPDLEWLEYIKVDPDGAFFSLETNQQRPVAHEPHEWFTAALDWYNSPELTANNVKSVAPVKRKLQPCHEWFTEALADFRPETPEQVAPVLEPNNVQAEWFSEAMSDFTPWVVTAPATPTTRDRGVEWFTTAMEGASPKHTQVAASLVGDASDWKHHEWFTQALTETEKSTMTKGADNNNEPQPLEHHEWFSEALGNLGTVPSKESDHVEWFTNAMDGFVPPASNVMAAPTKALGNVGAVPSKETDHSEWFTNAMDGFVPHASNVMAAPTQKNNVPGRNHKFLHSYWYAEALDDFNPSSVNPRGAVPNSESQQGEMVKGIPVYNSGGLKGYVFVTDKTAAPPRSP